MLNSANSRLIVRELKLSDYPQFKKLFYLCFKKHVSYKFFKWQYFDDKVSFCYGVFKSSEQIANVGMKFKYINLKKKSKIFSRHSSMVLKSYRNKGIFSRLLQEVKKKKFDNISAIIMWPNNNNFASFGISRLNLIKIKYFLYQKNKKIKPILKKTYNYRINELIKFKSFIDNNNSFLFKDLNYYKNRYLTFKKNYYFINKFNINNSTSFFILKKQKLNSSYFFVVLDHFGCDKIKSIHLNQLLKEEEKIIFWNKKKIQQKNCKQIGYINANVGLIKNKNEIKRKLIAQDKDLMPGDTDTFLELI